MDAYWHRRPCSLLVLPICLYHLKQSNKTTKNGHKFRRKSNSIHRRCARRHHRLAPRLTLSACWSASRKKCVLANEDELIRQAQLLALLDLMVKNDQRRDLFEHTHHGRTVSSSTSLAWRHIHTMFESVCLNLGAQLVGHSRRPQIVQFWGVLRDQVWHSIPSRCEWDTNENEAQEVQPCLHSLLTSTKTKEVNYGRVLFNVEL